jgi:hypothetical protein
VSRAICKVDAQDFRVHSGLIVGKMGQIEKHGWMEILVGQLPKKDHSLPSFGKQTDEAKALVQSSQKYN